MSRGRRLALAGGLACYLMSLAFIGGIVTERVRFDRQRAAIFKRYDEAVQRLHAELMALEQGMASHRQTRDR